MSDYLEQAHEYTWMSMWKYTEMYSSSVWQNFVSFVIIGKNKRMQCLVESVVCELRL